MGRNFIEGTQNVGLMSWGASAELKEQTKVVKKRRCYNSRYYAKWVEGRSYG